MTDDGTGEKRTHEQLLTMEDPKSMHARPATLLIARLRKAARGTRFRLRWGGQDVDLGEASEVGPPALLHCANVWCGQEVLARSSGPDADYVLDSVEEVFTQRR